MKHRAGFWIRFIAFIIDTIILSLAQFLLSFLISGYSLTEMNVLSTVINLILTFLYFVWLQVKFNGQTIGKKITGIRVAKLEGERVTIGQMALREIIGKLVSGLILLIGFLMAAGKSKRALHDYIAKTVVIRAE
jgi:uncharacterized RDD family membrane protein YckC